MSLRCARSTSSSCQGSSFCRASTWTRSSRLAPEVAAIHSHAAAGHVVVSICVGAFLLAEAGLLKGRRATTSWLFADELARRCPDADVRPERLVVTDKG
ncbi:DJ-1/PfpI family protein [Streptomyces aureus]